MFSRTNRARILPLAIALSLGIATAGCVGGLTSTRTEGYVLSESALRQIRPGQSEDLVIAVLGSPQTRGNFGNESAFYYISTKVNKTQFGLRMVQERTVLAIYFDENRRVKDTAQYGLQDGRVVTLTTRRTPSFGEDKTFIDSILSSF